MKRHFYTLICCLYMTLNSYGQSENLLRDYYYTINLAELSIIDNKLPEAKKNYEKAFGTGYSFPSDKFNAFAVSYFMKDTIKSIQYFNDLAALGQDKEKFIKYFLHSDPKPNPYIDYVTKDYKNINEKVMKSEMLLLAKKMDVMFQMDQDCRNNGSKDDLLNCDRNVRERLYAFVDTYGFPGYKKVGLLEEGVIQATNPGNFDMLLWHTRGFPDEKIYSIGLENVKKGIYDARRFAMGFFYQGSEYQVGTPYEPITREELDAINKKRAEIFLEPLEDYLRKVAYHTKNELYYRGDYCFLNPFLCIYSLNQPLVIKE
jgi:hypothetical protein